MDAKAVESAVARAVVKVFGRAPDRVQSLVGGRRVNRAGAVLEPEVAAALRLLDALPESDYTQLTAEAARRRVDEEAALFGGRPLPMALVEDVEIPTFAGPITGRRYLAHRDDADRLLVYFHGGGFVVGSLDSHDTVCRFLAEHAGVSVLAVDYRLAPEHPFPAALDDARAAFMFAASKAAAWGHDAHRIGVGGDSAGGNVSAVLCQDLAKAQVHPAFQLLLYPVTDTSRQSASYREFADGFYLTEKQMDWYTERYLGDADRTDPRVSPLLAEDLTGLPPAYVATAGFDPLRDEGEAYARRLAEAGVPVALRRHDSLIHAFVSTTGVGRSGREAVLEACGAIRMGLGAGLRRHAPR
ncbi:alpha/beta hydrolase [Nocardioides oleivorans]|uniref:Alpha/beta hydrolase n=1 Tax=Nocardioides oleivorans TaxID=273676 RepID=A0A4Q2RWK7_9ACTN|nr:alpha/beta hydrolase [Nocardioides oleivorans]RYB93368.1 alpha/beta hydrolase [Nocardioides oleivorans]